MNAMQQARANAKQRRRERIRGQPELFRGTDIYNPRFYLNLRARYTDISRRAVATMLNEQRIAPYDNLWSLAVSNPLTFESDLKGWLTQWADVIDIVGLKEKERVPKRGKGHKVAIKHPLPYL